MQIIIFKKFKDLIQPTEEDTFFNTRRNTKKNEDL